ncbi:hypothetical protein CFP56_023646 [Quercus suber]|uniref:Uncharacterized protein n=1 Tax=Quercus suber TaxID=58331 RepID=A0AAW0LXV8_QUESU
MDCLMVLYVLLLYNMITNELLGNLPSLPCPPSFDQSISAHDSEAPLVFSGDLDNLYDEEHSEVHMKGFLNFSGDASKI